jgi:hypothetical protein
MMYKVKINVEVFQMIEDGRYSWMEPDDGTSAKIQMEFYAAGLDQATVTANGVTTGLIQSAFADHYDKVDIRDMKSEEGAEEE